MFNIGLRSIGSVKIVADGIIANATFGEGRPIPVLIVDAANRPDIGEYIKAHEFEPPGDVNVQWGFAPMDRNKISLMVKSSRPVASEFGITFDAEPQFSLIDGILHAKALYLQVGKAGDKVSSKMDDPRILIEVPDIGFFKLWDKHLKTLLMKRFKKQGLAKAKSVAAADELIRSMRQFWSFRSDNA